MELLTLEEHMIEECVDVFIDTFTKEPWNDVYDSRQQVVDFFENHIKNNYFLGYVGIENNKIVAISIGMKKPWMNGMEYYIDEFCISHNMQGKGFGSQFLSKIEKDLKKLNLNGIILNTEKDYPAQKFYEKNGFKVLEGLIVLGK